MPKIIQIAIDPGAPGFRGEMWGLDDRGWLWAFDHPTLTWELVGENLPAATKEE